jgi:hypothetical protein
MLRGKSPPSGERWLRGNGGYGRTAPIVAIRCQAVDVARKISTVWRTVATGERCDGRTAPIVATRCQAVEVARKTPTVWRTVATAKRWMLRGKSPPSGERWLRASGGGCQENLHRLANGGYGRTVLRENDTHRSHPLPSGGDQPQWAITLGPVGAKASLKYPYTATCRAIVRSNRVGTE